MKKLLVLTDFTANSFKAEAAAIRLSSKLNASILLYHSSPVIPLIPNDTGVPYVVETESMLIEDNEEKLSQEADNLKKLAGETTTANPNIDYRNDVGSLGDVITAISDEPDIEMVVMGARTGGAFDHLLTGSATATVIRKSRKPVLIISMHSEPDIPRKVVFATNFGTRDMPAINYLLSMSQLLGYKLDVVHVLSQDKVAAEIDSELEFRKYLSQHQLNCTQVFNENVNDGLQQYTSEHGADLLAMTHGRHPFISRLFGRSDSMEAIVNQRLALLIFPPDFN